MPRRLLRWWPLLLLAVAAAVVIAVLARAALAGRDPVWERIQDTGVWRIGMDPSFPPFEDLDAAGQPFGLDVELAEAIAARWGVRLEIAGIGFDQLIDAVAARRVDAAVSGLPIVEHRAKEVAFSSPYVEAGIVLAAPAGAALRGPADLAGLRVAAEWGSAGDAQARLLQKELGGNLALVLRESADAALAAVTAGEADAAVVDAVSLALYGAGGLAAVGGPLASDPLVIMVPAGAARLLGAVNEALAALEADGTLARIKARWLNGDVQ